MKWFAAATVLVAAPVAAMREKITPIQKVLDMLDGMVTKGEKMKEEEQQIFKTYAEWVDDQTKEHGFQIKEAETKIEDFIAFVGKADSDVKKFGDEIDALDDDEDRMSGELKDATALREEEHAEFVKVEDDYSGSVDALERAIQTMQAQDYDRPQAEALLQRMAKGSSAMHSVLEAFVQQQDSASGNGAPAVAAYDSQGGGVVEMMEGLLKKFQGELSDTVNEESEKSHNYDLTKLHLTETIKKTKADRSEKAAVKASTAAASAKAKGELGETKKSLAEDKKFVADTNAEFKAKTDAFETNQKVRTDELVAINKALEIMSSGAAAGGYKKHVNLVQAPTAASLLQMRSTTRRETARQQAAAFLKTRASALSSRTLDNLVSKMAASPFAKVIDMIETLLAKLKQEAQEEAAHKEWCDEQLKTNKMKRDKKTASVERLSAEQESLDGQIESMGNDIAKLVQEQADLSKAMLEATEQREAENTENTQTIADAAAGAEATKSALVVLREFYAKQSFMQADQAPEMAAYSGMSSAKGGVVGMLEVIESDFKRLEADTKAAEKQAATEYDTFMADAKSDTKQKHDTEAKTRLDKDQAEFERGRVHEDLVDVEAELAKANEYYETLKPSCLEVHVSYEERVAKRKEEIESLKGAYQMLAAKGA